ncbi:MAG: ORF6N domain-containing protein [Campylobacterales bacterium]|nr:ORF6N domain-containing protein [Campylobacterales bacterium]
MESLIVGNVENKIFIIRGIQVMIDRDLAELYQVETKRLNEQVKRNIERFPSDFMFELSEKEKEEVVAKCDHLKGLKFSSTLPRVFTEQGVYMLATILKSKIAIEVNISIMRTFTKLKNQSVPYFDIIKRLEKLEANDKETRELLSKVVQVVSDMQSIQDEARENTRRIGFVE